MNKGSLRVLAIAALFGGQAAGHAPVIREGVHFTADLMDFTSPPPRYMHYFGSTTRPGTEVLRGEYDYDYELEERRLKGIAKRLKDALAAEKRGRYSRALALYQGLQSTPVEPIWDGDSAVGLQLPQPDFLQQRVEVLGRAQRHREKGIAKYLEVTRPGRRETTVGGSEEYSPFLLAFLQYRVAMNAWPQPELSARHFEALAKDAPDSPRAEAALIMVPRLLLAESPPLPAGAELLARCRRSDWAVRRLLLQHPKTRFRFDAFGALGRIEFLLGREDSALPHYRRQLGMAKTNDQRVQAWASIALCETEIGRQAGGDTANVERIALAHLLRFENVRDTAKRVAAGQLKGVVKLLDAQRAARFVQLLRKDERALPAYLDWRLDLTETTRVQRGNLVAIARAWVRAHPGSPQAGRVLARSAEIELDLGHSSNALAMSRRALARARIGDADAALAEFVLGSAARRAGKVTGAVRAFEGLVRRHPASYLVGAARENLALLYERQGRLGNALDQYYALDYRYDVAYLVDVRMSPAELRSYIATHPRHRHAKELRFSLGLRYLRVGDWARAESRFLSLRGADRKEMVDPKDREEWRVGFDDPASLRDPLLTTRELRRLDRDVQKARGSVAKATALYQLANSYYKRRNLALYNYRMWEGDRANAFGFSWNHAVASEADERALVRHHFEHECMAHTLALCERVVRDYPKAAVSVDAAYLGAGSARRLASLNPWWRAEGRADALFARSRKLFEFIVKTRPSHPLAEHAAQKIRLIEADRIERAASELEYGTRSSKREWPGF